MRLERTVILFVIVGLLFLGLLFVQNQGGNAMNALVLQTLNAQGFTDLQVNWTVANWVCESGERGYKFTGKTTAGEPVSGIVCARIIPTRYAYIRYQ